MAIPINTTSECGAATSAAEMFFVPDDLGLNMDIDASRMHYRNLITKIRLQHAIFQARRASQARGD